MSMKNYSSIQDDALIDFDFGIYLSQGDGGIFGASNPRADGEAIPEQMPFRRMMSFSG